MGGIKAGYKTTEFWLTVLANLLGLLMASGAICTASDTPTAALACKVVGIALMALTTAGYSVGRGLAKSSDTAAK